MEYGEYGLLIYIYIVYFIEFALHIKTVLNLKEIAIRWTRWVCG